MFGKSPEKTPIGFPSTRRNLPLDEAVIKAERKIIIVGKYENDRGAFLRITETSSIGRSNTIIVPVDGAVELAKAIKSVAAAKKKKEPKQETVSD